MVILAGELLKEAKTFIEDGVHPMNVIKSFERRGFGDGAREGVVDVDRGGSAAEKDELLKKCAMTTEFQARRRRKGFSPTCACARAFARSRLVGSEDDRRKEGDGR